MNFDQTSQSEVNNSQSVNLTNENFVQEVIEKSKSIPVIVDFWAPWCEPCKQIAPILDKLVASSNGRVVLTKMNIDEHPEISQQLQIQSIPAILGFHNGQPVDGFVGVQPESAIKAFVEKLADLNVHPEDMDFDVRFVGERFQQSVPQAYYHELLTATSSAVIEKNIPGRELRWIVYEKNSKKIVG